MYVSPIFLQHRVLLFAKTVFEYSSLAALMWVITQYSNVLLAIVFAMSYVFVVILCEILENIARQQSHHIEVEDYEVDVEDYPDEDI